jgi:hypothetical protein
MAQDLPAVLLVGGGEGMGALEATVEQLDASLQGSAQVRQGCDNIMIHIHGLLSLAVACHDRKTCGDCTSA